MASRKKEPLKITGWLDAPLAGPAPPYLDAVLELKLSHQSKHGAPRGAPVPAAAVGKIATPIGRREIGGISIPQCSSPIYRALDDRHEHYTRSLAQTDSHLLRADRRLVLNTGSGLHRSYRLPLRVRLIERVVWFALADASWLERILIKHRNGITALGKKTSQGYGRIRRWEIESSQQRAWWFAASEAGPVLMRPLPACDELPDNLVGGRRSYGGCRAPYWQADLYREIVVPC